jgi:hypothetical protein
LIDPTSFDDGGGSEIEERIWWEVSGSSNSFGGFGINERRIGVDALRSSIIVIRDLMFWSSFVEEEGEGLKTLDFFLERDYDESR